MCQGTCHVLVDTGELPNQLTNLFVEAYLELTYEELLDKCENVVSNVSLTQESSTFCLKDGDNGLSLTPPCLLLSGTSANDRSCVGQIIVALLCGVIVKW